MSVTHQHKHMLWAVPPAGGTMGTWDCAGTTGWTESSIRACLMEHAFFFCRLYFSFDYLIRVCAHAKWMLLHGLLCCTKEIMFSFLPSSSLCTCFLSATRLPLLCKTKQVGVIGWHFTCALTHFLKTFDLSTWLFYFNNFYKVSICLLKTVPF